MKLDKARQLDCPSYCYLASGAVLRYDPDDGVVRKLAYPAQPSAWRAAHYFMGDAPQEGWCHLFGCTCDACQEEAASTR